MASTAQVVPGGDLGKLATTRMAQSSRLLYVWLPVFGVAGVAALLLSAMPDLAVWLAPIVIAPLVLGLLVTPRIERADEARRTTAATFDLSGESGVRWEALNRALEALARSDGVWFTYETGSRIDEYGQEEPEYAYLLERCTVGQRRPAYIATNVEPFAIVLPGGDAMYFLPDAILAYIAGRPRGQYFSLPYTGLRFASECDMPLTLWRQAIPAGANVIGQRWLYERKDGGPDLRYRDNYQSPVIVTGCVNLFAPEPVVLQFNVSRRDDRRAIADLFGEAFGIPVHHQDDRQEDAGTESSASSPSRKRRRTRAKPSRPSAQEDSPPSPFDILGVREGATPQEIATAYRAKAQQYHPDKVAMLGPELRELAARKMQEINAAYQALKGS